EGVVAVVPGEQAEGEKQRQRAQARHQQIDVSGAEVLRLLVMRHHQRPGAKRHELPRNQKAESVVRQHDEIHRRQISRIERQHAMRRLFVPAIAKGVEARRGAADIDHHEEKSGERIDAKMSTQPRKTERQRYGMCRRIGDEHGQCSAKRQHRNSETATIDKKPPHLRAREPDSENTEAKQQGRAGKKENDDHQGGLSLTPRPPPALVPPSGMSSIPAAFSASTSFIKESTLPRLVPSLASMR